MNQHLRQAIQKLASAIIGLILLNPLAPVALAQVDARQMQLLTTKCVQCHAEPHTGAPQIGRPEQWRAVISQSEEATLKNVVEGIGGMPPLGYCSACSEQDLRSLTRFVAGFPDSTGGNKP